nr:MAG TPA: hypothetical protein [Caudoviricetes sp.]DAU71569.1 MAG TPA: hypothetical protein [Caudoviricetes sp.]
MGLGHKTQTQSQKPALACYVDLQARFFFLASSFLIDSFFERFQSLFSSLKQ